MTIIFYPNPVRRNVSWDEAEIRFKLENLATANQVRWIRRDLSIPRCGLLERIFWVVLKHFECMQRWFFDVDFAVSADILNRLGVDVQYNPALSRLFLAAIHNFERVSGRPVFLGVVPTAPPYVAQQPPVVIIQQQPPTVVERVVYVNNPPQFTPSEARAVPVYAPSPWQNIRNARQFVQLASPLSFVYPPRTLAGHVVQDTRPNAGSAPIFRDHVIPGTGSNEFSTAAHPNAGPASTFMDHVIPGTDADRRSTAAHPNAGSASTFMDHVIPGTDADRRSTAAHPNAGSATASGGQVIPGLRRGRKP